MTAEHLRDARAALKRAQKYMGPDEREASEKLFKMATRRALGKTARQLLSMLDDDQLMNEVQEALQKVKSIRTTDDEPRR